MLGRYRIDNALGEGAMAVVYSAHDTGIGRTAAIKVLKGEFARNDELGARFLREARAAGALNHPNIATIYDVGESEGLPYIAMELVDGKPLDAVIKAHGRLPYERVLLLGQQLAAALGYAHRAGVVHRDVKPSNILLSEDERTAKLLDFGVARVGDGDSESLAQTQVGQMIGTPRYMSPEQALGLPVDHRSDLFSLGVVLYEMVTGKVAFPGTGLATLAVQIAQERVEPIDRTAADCPAGLRAIIDKLLAKKPEQRFQDGDALAEALAREIAATKERPVGRRGLPLRIKLPLVLSTVTATALLVSVYSVLDREQRALEHMAVVSGDSIAAFVTANAAVQAADNAGLPTAQQDWSALQAFVVTAARDRGIRHIVVADAAGVVRAADMPALIGQHYHTQAGEERVEASGDTIVTATAGADTPGLRFSQPVRYAGARFGTVDLVMRRDALDEAISNARLLLTILSAIVIAVVAIAGYACATAVAAPLARLHRALADAATSGFSARIAHRRRDEFGAAFDAFNRAVEEAESRIGVDQREFEAAAVATRVAPPRQAA